MLTSKSTMGDEEGCNTGLGLALGVGEYMPKRNYPKNKNKRIVWLDLLFPLSAKKEEQVMDADNKTEGSSTKTFEEDENGNCKTSNNNNNHNDENKNCSSRKKLRLTKEQSTLLEDSFKQHNTLNMGQKQALAEKLDLRPRQVEVWFQNRRARTKLKQKEVDCEFLQKRCESLSDENRRLKKELQEFRAWKIEHPPPAPLCIQFPTNSSAASFTMCPSCDKVVKAAANANNTTEAAIPTASAAAASAITIDVVQ